MIAEVIGKLYNNDEQNNPEQQRSVLEAKIKKIDEQIALLNTIKNQSLSRLQSLPHIASQQANPVVNNVEDILSTVDEGRFITVSTPIEAIQL